MVEVIFGQLFEKDFSKIKDRVTKDKIIKQVSKIKEIEGSLRPKGRSIASSISEFAKRAHPLAKASGIRHASQIKDNPEIGKPMRYTRKGTREVYIPPFRLSYKIEGETVYILALYHKDEQ